MNTNDLSNLKVGDKCWSIQLGECEVRSRWESGTVICENALGYEQTYNPDGKQGTAEYAPSLFRTKPDWAKTKVKVKKKIEQQVRILLDKQNELREVRWGDYPEAVPRSMPGTLIYYLEVDE